VRRIDPQRGDPMQLVKGGHKIPGDMATNCKSQNEVAAILGISRAAVSDTERRAIRKIRKAVLAGALECGVTIREYLYGRE
jgi:predicted XRE-type DNA-binding protein